MAFGSEIRVQGPRNELVMREFAYKDLAAWPALDAEHPMFAEMGPESKMKLEDLFNSRATFYDTLAAPSSGQHWGLMIDDTMTGILSLLPNEKYNVPMGRTVVLPEYWKGHGAP